MEGLTPEDFFSAPVIDWYELAAAAAAQQMELVIGQSNIFPRPNVMKKKGDVLAGHTHTFDHVTFVAKGAIGVSVEIDGQTVQRRVKAGSGVLIKADREHTIIALQDDTRFVCIYAHRDAQGEVQQKFTGFEKAYT